MKVLKINWLLNKNRLSMQNDKFTRLLHLLYWIKGLSKENGWLCVLRYSFANYD